MDGMGGFNNPNNNMKQPPIPFNQNNLTRKILFIQKLLPMDKNLLVLQEKF